MRLEKLMCEKLWKWKNFMHFLTLFYVSVLTSVSADYAIVISVSASVSADMKIRYIGGYRYRPIWKNAYRSPTNSGSDAVCRVGVELEMIAWSQQNASFCHFKRKKFFFQFPPKQNPQAKCFKITSLLSITGFGLNRCF